MNDEFNINEIPPVWVQKFRGTGTWPVVLAGIARVLGTKDCMRLLMCALAMDDGVIDPVVNFHITTEGGQCFDLTPLYDEFD